MKKDAIPYGVWAWKLNEIIMAMNDEGAYESWIYLWPDGLTQQEALTEFGTKEDYQELEEKFKRVYKAYHRAGLYTSTPKILEYAHAWDKKLGLPEIQDVSKAKTPEYNDDLEKQIIEILDQNEIYYDEIDEEYDEGLEDHPYKVVYFYENDDAWKRAYHLLKGKFTQVKPYRDFNAYQILITNDDFDYNAADINDSKSVKDTIINLDQLKEGQSVKLVDDLLFDEVETTKETYEDDYDKIFKEKLFDNVPYSYVPAGTILTLKEKYGPAGGWPCFIINGVEVDLCGDLDEYKGILINEFKDSEAYVYKLVHDYNSKNIDDESVEYDYWKKRFPKLRIEKIEKLTNIPNSNWKVTLVGRFNDLYKAAVYLGYDEDDIQDTLVFYDSKKVKDSKVVTYSIENDDPKMEDFKQYENDYNIECKLVYDGREFGEYSFVWEVSGKEEDILDFINDYCLDEVATKISDSKTVKDEDIIITMEEMQEGQKGKLLDDVPYGYLEDEKELCEDYDENFDDAFIEGKYQGYPWAIIPKGKIITLKQKNGPAGGAPVFDINGVERDFGDDISDYRVLLLSKSMKNDSKTVKDIKPRKNESKEDFISRFMSETKEEYPDQKQRLAVAYSYWERRNKKSTKDSLDDKDYNKICKQVRKDVDYDIQTGLGTQDDYYYMVGTELASRDLPFLPYYFLPDHLNEQDDEYQQIKQGYLDNGGKIDESFEDSLGNDLIEILVANGTCDTKKVAKQYISKMSKEEKDELWKSIKKQAQYLLVNDSVITDSEFSNTARGKFRVPAEPLGSVKVWYQNDDQIKKDYERLVEYAENNAPRADNPLLGVSTYEQTIGKDTKQVSEGYMTLNGNRIVLVKDIDEQYVVDAMQEYYYEIADMSLEEFIETFVEDEQVFKEKMKQQTEAAKAEKKAAKEKEKEDNKIRQSFEGLIVYGAYVKVRDVYKKDFKPTEDKENSCYFEVSEHMTKDKSILKFINIYYHNSVLPVTVNNVFGKSNKYYDDNEKLCQIYLLNLDVFAIRQKINMIDYNDRLSASLKK